MICEAGPDAEVLEAVLERSEIQSARSVNPSLTNRRR